MNQMGEQPLHTLVTRSASHSSERLYLGVTRFRSETPKQYQLLCSHQQQPTATSHVAVALKNNDQHCEAAAINTGAAALCTAPLEPHYLPLNTPMPHARLACTLAVTISQARYIPVPAAPVRALQCTLRSHHHSLMWPHLTSLTLTGRPCLTACVNA